MIKSKDKVVEEYLKALIGSLKNGGRTHFWPTGPGQADSYFGDILAINIFEKFKKDPNKFRKALALLTLKNLRWFLIPLVVLGVKLAKNYEGYQVKPEELVGFIKGVRNALLTIFRSDPFCLDGKSLLISQDYIDNLATTRSWFNKEEKRKVALLSIDLESYVWSIDFDLFAYGVFWHGPYTTSDKKCLVIKEFIDLDSEVWNLNIPYSNIKILYLFKDQVDVRIDFMGHIVYQNNIWEKLDKIAIKVDGNYLKNASEIEKLSTFFSAKREEQVKLVEGLTKEDIIRKAAEINYYMFRNFFNYYNEDWKPSKEIDQRIKELGLKYWNEFQQNHQGKRASDDFFVKLYSPENNFTG